MQSMSASIAVRSLLLLSLAACAAGPERSLGTKGSTTWSRDDVPNPVVQSLVGHWEVVGTAGNLNKVSVSAEKHLDGSVSGEVQFERFTPDGLSILAHGTILCLTVDGSTARLAMLGDETTAAGTNTVYGILTAIDNGEGDPSPDRASSIFVERTESIALSHCDASLIPDDRIFDIQRGDIQVLP